jgi:Sulfotransferase domain
MDATSLCCTDIAAEMRAETGSSVGLGKVSENAGEDHRKAVWIASYPKSGNTWLRIFIHNLMRELAGETDGRQDINRLSKWSTIEARKNDFTRRLGKPAEDASVAEIAATRRLVQADLVHDRKRPVFIKTHNAVASVEGFPTINFDVTWAAIYAVRNPLDVTISYAHHTAMSIDAIIEGMADSKAMSEVTKDRRVYDFMSSWSFHVASWISVPHRPVLIIRYEDMLAAPERSFGRLARFLRLQPSTEQLRRAIEKSSFDELARQEGKNGFVERPKTAEKFFRSGKADQWKEVLSPQQVHAITRVHAPMMMRCGYLVESCSP